MKCTNCGHELPEGSRFCDECGAAVQEAKAVPQKKGWQTKYTILIVVAVLLLAGGSVLAYMGLNGGAEQGSETVETDVDKSGKDDDAEEDKTDVSEKVEEKIDIFNDDENAVECEAQAQAFSMEHVINISATSELSEYNMTHYAKRVVDDDLSTAWVEGVKGQGEGESITLQFDDEYEVKGLRIYSGYQKKADLYQKNSRPAKLRITFADGSSEVCELRDVNDMQELAFKNTVVTDKITIAIEEVYKGSKYEDTVISEIYIY